MIESKQSRILPLAANLISHSHYFPGRTRLFNLFTNRLKFTPGWVRHHKGFSWFIDSPHAQQMYLYSCEPFTSKVLSKLSSKASHFLDIGANRGWYSILLKNWNNKLVIHAFEPDQKIFQVLKKNLSQFGNFDDSIHTEHCGVGQSIGTATLTTYVEGNDGMKTFFPGGSLKVASQEVVQIVTLDSYLVSYLNPGKSPSFLLKIDVEGSEFEVILGGKDFIKEYQPIIVMEINALLLSHANVSSQTIFKFMESLGYIFFWLDEREDIIQINDLDSLPHEALLGSGHGANYLLIPKQSVNKGLVNELGYTKDLNWIY
jgi:FkbM family methyltransferase